MTHRLVNSSVHCCLWYCVNCIRQSVPKSILQSSVSSLFIWLDYGMAGIPSHLLSQLQSVMNTAAWLIFSLLRFDRITSLLCQLHWLKASDWIAFKCANVVYSTALIEVLTGLHLRTSSTNFVKWQTVWLVSDCLGLVFITDRRPHSSVYCW